MSYIVFIILYRRKMEQTTKRKLSDAISMAFGIYSDPNDVLWFLLGYLAMEGGVLEDTILDLAVEKGKGGK